MLLVDIRTADENGQANEEDLMELVDIVLIAVLIVDDDDEILPIPMLNLKCNGSTVNRNKGT